MRPIRHFMTGEQIGCDRFPRLYALQIWTAADGIACTILGFFGDYMQLKDLQTKLDAMEFVQFYGLHIESLEPNRCMTRIAYQKKLERPGGIVAGPTFMMTADVTFWLALVGELGVDTPLVTANLQSAFLNACREEDIICEARVLKFGRRLIYGTAECRSPRGQLFTHHAVTYARIIRE